MARVLLIGKQLAPNSTNFIISGTSSERKPGLCHVPFKTMESEMKVVLCV